MSRTSNFMWFFFCIGLVLTLVRLAYLRLFHREKEINEVPFKDWWVIFFGVYISLLSIESQLRGSCPMACRARWHANDTFIM